MKKTCRKKRYKKNKTHRKRKGGSAKLTVAYGQNSIMNGVDLSGKPNLYKQIPKITINLNDEKTYLVTLTDPDAPAGQWTHYVALIKTNGTVQKYIYNYEPPNPPANSGVHHYNFNIYSKNIIPRDNLKKLPGNLYYKQELEPLIKNLQPQATLQFTVKS